MKKCCCIVWAAFFALTFVTTTRASDFVLEFYLQTGSSSVVPIKSLHCMLIDSKNNNVLDKRFENDENCQINVSLETGEYSLIAEDSVSHYFGSTKFLISAQSSSSMVFLLNKLGLSYLEGVHSCERNLVCLSDGECDCDDKCLCKQFRQKVMLQPVGQTTNHIESSSNTVRSTEYSTGIVNEKRIAGQPFCSSCSYSNLCEGFVNGCGAVDCSVGAGFGAWGVLGMLGMLGMIHCKPVSEEPVYR